MNDLNNFEHLPTAVSETPSTASSSWFAKLIDRTAVEGSPKRIRSITLLNLANYLAGILTSAISTTSSIAATSTITSASSIKSTSATAGVGYATGAGGAVLQEGSKSAGVILNKVCGTITMNNAALLNATTVAFTLTNSTIAATDVVVISEKSGGTSGAYSIHVGAVANGSCSIEVRNQSGGPLSEALVLNFAVIKAVAA